MTLDVPHDKRHGGGTEAAHGAFDQLHNAAVEWTVVGSTPNPWGRVPVSAGGRSLVPRVEEYMARAWEAATRRDCVSRRHHYVPQSYLRAWSTDGRRVRVLDTRNGADRTQGLRDTCVEQDFYRVTDSTDTRHNQVEAMLAVIDDETARLLRLLRSWSPGDDVAFDDFMSLAVVVALQRNRTPQTRRFLIATSEWSARRAGQPAQHLTNDYFVDSLFRSAYEAADQFSTRQLELWDDPRGRFITCDQPVVLSPGPAGAPPGMDTSPHVWWPITPTRLLLFSNTPQGQKIVHRVATRRQVEQVRQAFVRGAESAVIALPGDLDLPSGRKLAKRPQLQVGCQPIDVEARKCRIGFTWGYHRGVQDEACRTICALTGHAGAGR